MISLKASQTFTKEDGTEINATLYIEEDTEQKWRKYYLVYSSKRFHPQNIIGSMTLLINTFSKEPHIEIELLSNHTFDENQRIRGIGLFMIVEAFKYSFQMGFNGRLRVVANCDSYNFYKRIGFRAAHMNNSDFITMYLPNRIIYLWLSILNGYNLPRVIKTVNRHKAQCKL